MKFPRRAVSILPEGVPRVPSLPVANSAQTRRSGLGVLVDNRIVFAFKQRAFPFQ